MDIRHRGIKVIPGSPDILLIAPHGLSEDDENTDRLSRQAAERLGCTAIINDRMPRKQLDFNIIPQAERHATFIPTIKNTISAAGCTRVVWVHGMRDQSACGEACMLNAGAAVHCLIGYGLPDRVTAQPDSVVCVLTYLQTRGFNTYVASDRRSKFRGYSAGNMNQWFRNNGYPLSRVESMQFEFSWTGVREEGSIDRTARVMSDALTQLRYLDS